MTLTTALSLMFVLGFLVGCLTAWLALQLAYDFGIVEYRGLSERRRLP